MFDESNARNSLIFNNLFNNDEFENSYEYRYIDIDRNVRDYDLRFVDRYLEDVYLYIKLPNITTVSGSYSRYVRKVAYAIVNKIRLFDQSVLIGSVDKYILDIINQDQKLEKDVYNNDFMNSFSIMDQNNDNLEFIIPIPFWFSRKRKHIPLIKSGTYQHISVMLEDLEKLIISDGTYNLDGDEDIKLYFKLKLPDVDIEDGKRFYKMEDSFSEYTTLFNTRILQIDNNNLIFVPDNGYMLYSNTLYFMFKIRGSGFFDYSFNSRNIAKNFHIRFMDRDIIPDRTPEIIIRGMNNISKYIYKVNIVSNLNDFSDITKKFYDELYIKIELEDYIIGQDIDVVIVDEYSSAIDLIDDYFVTGKIKD